MGEFKLLTPDEVITVLESVEPIRLDLKQISVLEMVKHFKTVGWLITAKVKKNGKLQLVGVAHEQLNKPLFFENKKDADLFAKKARQVLKEHKANV